MRSSRVPGLVIIALLTLCFGLAANLDTWFRAFAAERGQNANVLTVLLGDSRRMFANHFYLKADAYFHSGFYPGVFDNNQAFETPHIAEDSGAAAGQNQGDELGFMGQPRDWIEAFSRKFFPSVHTHLDEGGAGAQSGEAPTLGKGAGVREILPWLRISADLDPNRVSTYTVAAYWLRDRMGKVDEAEAFLREGLLANPNSYEILYELGRVYDENRKDSIRARNLWIAAERQWQKQEGGKSDPDKFLYVEIASHLAGLEKREGNIAQALFWMGKWKERSPNPEAVQKLIDDLKQMPPPPKTESPGSRKGDPPR